MGKLPNEKRKEDNKRERLVTEYAHEHIVPILGQNIEIVTDRKSQLAGIDLIMDYRGNRVNVDEKSVCRWINPPLYSFELYCEINEHHNGWFTSEISETDYYLLYLAKNPDNDEVLNTEDYDEWATNFKQIECLLVSKEKVKEYVDKVLQMTFEEMIKKGLELRENGERDFRINKYAKIVNMDWIVPEQPINLQFKTNVLRNIADKRLFFNVDFTKE